MRGKPDSGYPDARGNGLIPAHAGKTPRGIVTSFGLWAHPRACGENPRYQLTVKTVSGSSPRMRGKRSGRSPANWRAGLIPAHAGKTGLFFVVCVFVWAHPRACGENFEFPYAGAPRGGSSPRMRGKRYPPPFVNSDTRLIPAHAGKTRRLWSINVGLGAHPRACGENAERSGVLALRSVRSWKTFSFPSSLKVTHCRAFVQLPFSRIRL